jgi:hypothetical protein
MIKTDKLKELLVSQTKEKFLKDRKKYTHVSRNSFAKFKKPVDDLNFDDG